MVTITSYGARWGESPRDLTVGPFDCRFLRNPHRDRTLRYLRGTDPRVITDVLATREAREYVIRITEMAREGDRLGIYCFSGRHRSVVIAEAVASALRASGRAVTVIHRDMTREKEA